MKLCEYATDQQIGVLALLVICVLAVGSGIEGSKDILIYVAGAISGWLTKTHISDPDLRMSNRPYYADVLKPETKSKKEKE